MSNYLKENPLRRKIFIGCGIIVTLVATCLFCITTLGIVGNLLPTLTPTLTLTLTPTLTETTAPTDTQSPTSTFTPTETITPTITQSPTSTFTPTITFTPTRTQMSTETLTLTPTITNTPGAPVSGFILISIDETAVVGGGAGAQIRTQPGAQCTLTFYLPSGRVSTAAGTGARTADMDGYCTWYWDIKGNVKPGTGTAIITAGGQTKNYSIKIN